MKNAIRTIFLTMILGAILGGCYTQIQITKTTEDAAQRWEERNDYHSYNHSPCRWCSQWHYYYDYPWWLDQYWWWDNYYPEPEAEKRSKRYDRRRGLGEAIESIIESSDERDEPSGNEPDSDSEDSNEDDTEQRPTRRRGL